MIEGWTEEGKTREKAYDSASDDRKIGKDGKAPAAGNTVDLKGLSFASTIGDALMFAHWTDPDFDASQSAFYYVRVIEIPTPIWAAYDAAFFSSKY